MVKNKKEDKKLTGEQAIKKIQTLNASNWLPKYGKPSGLPCFPILAPQPISLKDMDKALDIFL